MEMKKDADKLMAAMPSLNDVELEEANSYFKAYIFRRKKTRELWTTCCGRHEIVPKSEYSDDLHVAMEAEHHRETELIPADFGPNYRTVKREGGLYTISCPFCGAGAYVKELGRTGKRYNLAEFINFAYIRWYRGALWVRAYESRKKYENIGSLTNRPIMTLRKVYRFKPGEAIQITSNCYWSSDPQFDYVTRLAERPKTLPLQIYEPFSDYSEAGSGYALLGIEQIEKSPFRYSQYEEFFGRYASCMRFLAVCCIFPRQVEMLMKAGFAEAVQDLVCGRKWNAAAFNWSEGNPLTSFGLDKNEMKAFLGSSKSLETLAYYKQFRRRKFKCELLDVDRIVLCSPYGKTAEVMKALKEYAIEPAKWNAYIEKETEKANNRKKQRLLMPRDVAQYWLDYLGAAVETGSDLTNPLVQMPKGLKKKHDERTRAAEAVRAAKRREDEKARTEEAKRRAEELREKSAARLKECTALYAFEYGDWLIRPPVDAAEIAEEGKKLKHCVGGYAERHILGKLAILFLRDAANPEKPLVTIEMSGKKLIQLHGYNNDRNEKVEPRVKYAEILDVWLEWVSAGSKRNKSGKPKIPKVEKAPQAEFAVAS